MAQQDFVDLHSAALIQRVIPVMPLADELLAKNMLSLEMYSEIRATNTSQNKMRTLLSVVKSGGHQVKSYFYELLQLHQPYLVKDITGRPTKGGNLRWNQSSIKHRRAIKRLQKQKKKHKIGNIYFSKKYSIGSGSSGTQVFVGLKEDGTEVAVKRILKCQWNNKNFENELKHLQGFESTSIVRYMDFAEDDDFYYLALQLCECDLESYMEDLREPENQDRKHTALKKTVKDVLHGLKYLHGAEVNVIHRDIKPKNVLIDLGNKARLADFGLSRRLEEGSSVNTARAGTRGWEAVETLDSFEESKYKKSSDVQVAGMLVYYILSDGKHPFGVNTLDRETNIRDGKYSLDDVCDIVAQDLIKWMINVNPAQRPTINEVLKHPFFWDDDKKDAVIRKLGDREEVQYYVTLEQIYNLCYPRENDEGGNPRAEFTLDEAIQHVLNKIQNKNKREVRNGIQKAVGEDLAKLQNLCDSAKKHSEERTFSAWKTDLSRIWTLPRDTPEDLLGLFRFIRNKLVHEKDQFDEKNMLNHFPDFFISLHRLTKDLNWDY